MAGISGPDIVSNGLALLLDTEDKNSYPGSGTQWKDVSGGGSIATISGGVTYVGDGRGALVFNGTNGSATIGALAGSFSNFTVIVWFNPSSVTSYENVIDCNYAYNGTTGNIGPRLEMNSGGTLGWIYSNVTNSNGSYFNHPVVQSGLTPNIWHCAAITWDRSNGNISTTYYNGKPTGLSRAVVGSPSGFVGQMSNVTVGRGFHLGGAERLFTGKVSNIQIYNRSLSAGEIKQNFESMRESFILDGSSISKAAPSASYLLSNGFSTNGEYWINPPGHAGDARKVYVDFNGSKSQISDPGPWVRVRYSQDYYSRTTPWKGTGNSSTSPGAYSGDFAFEQGDAWISALLANSSETRQRFESWGYGSVGWTYSTGMYMGVKAFNGTLYNGSTGSNIVKTNKPAGISHGVVDFNTFNNPTAQGTDPTDTNDNTWRVGVFYFRDTSSGLGILPIKGIYNGDVDGATEQRYFPFRNGESPVNTESDIWIKN